MSATSTRRVPPGEAIGATGIYRVRPFRASDYAALQRPSGVQDGTLLSAGRADPLEVGRCYERFGQAFTALRAGEVLACAGILRKWEGLGEAWLTLTSLGTAQHGLDVFWMIRRRFRELMAGMVLRRVEADVQVGVEKAERLVVLLGFERESIMPRYGPNGATYGKWVILAETVE